MEENVPGELLKLEGVVQHVIYENPESGYAVFEVDAGGSDIVVAGNVGSVDNGMSVTAYGYMVNHPSYGEQFRAETCETSLPQDTSSLLSYLSSGVLPYIGPSTAKKIVAKFGTETLTVISETPEKLCELKGITPQKATAISNEFRRMFGVREVIAWMAKFGLSAQMAVTAYRTYGPHTVDALQQNPYLLCGEPLNLKFSQADGIAAKLQFEQGCDLRIAAGLTYALRHNANNGHTCLPEEKLVESTARFIRVEPKRVRSALGELLEREEMRSRMFDGVKYIYLPAQCRGRYCRAAGGAGDLSNGAAAHAGERHPGVGADAGVCLRASSAGGHPNGALFPGYGADRRSGYRKDHHRQGHSEPV